MKNKKKTYDVPESSPLSFEEYEILKKATITEMLDDTRELIAEMLKTVGVEVKDGKLPEDVNYKLNIDRVYNVELASLKQLTVKLEVAKVQVKDANKQGQTIGEQEAEVARKWLEEQEKQVKNEN